MTVDLTSFQMGLACGLIVVDVLILGLAVLLTMFPFDKDD